MMRVLLITDNLDSKNGGAERQATLLAASLVPSHSVTVFSLAGGSFCRDLRDHDVRVEVFERRHRFDPAPAMRMWSAARDLRPDVVHSWTWMASLAMLPFCRHMKVPLVDGTIRLGCRPRRRLAARRLGIALADRVVANSQAGLAAFGISEERGRVVYNGFDVSRLDSIPRITEQSRFPALTTVVMTGRMTPEKDWSLFLRAARKLAATDDRRWRFIAVGEGPDRNRLMQEAADLVTDGVVVFQPGRIEVLPIVAFADIGVLLTNVSLHAEGCSNSIMEYMACGLPVVCTDCGGNAEIVEEGRTGYLIPASDDEILAAKLRDLRDNPARARSMGDAGARRLAEDFTVQAMVDGYASVYDQACGG